MCVQISIFKALLYKICGNKTQKYNLFCQVALNNDTIVVSNCFNKTQIKNIQLFSKICFNCMKFE